ncbi:hypothetical protein K469DRAFT_793261 [Zopfia rhizophila CBS 207.26]|uniref:Uncharacterized protein n=1 Tax=Zopfia rhizophila CBS 207.26 TaxID=1314779 RepID=A0A6A6DMU3_9PEZI|nr:hypothetical protein K469DRAFT_793261 [Zopfia rhizophila CBS 207.26]
MKFEFVTLFLGPERNFDDLDILFPRSALFQVVRGIEHLISTNEGPGVNSFLYVLRNKLRKRLHNEDDERIVDNGDGTLVIDTYDNGEVDGREAFRFAHETPGAVDDTHAMNVRGIVNIHRNVLQKGDSKAALQRLDDGSQKRCVQIGYESRCGIKKLFIVGDTTLLFSIQTIRIIEYD